MSNEVTGSLLWTTFRRFWWAVLVAMLVAGALTTLTLNAKPPKYESEARLLIGPLTGTTDSLRASASLGLTYQDALKTTEVLDRVASEAGVNGLSESQLHSLVNVAFNDKSRVLTILGVGEDPAVSKHVVELMVEEVANLQEQVPDVEVVQNATSDVLQQARTRRASGAVTEIVPASLPQDSVDQREPLLVGLAALLGGALMFAGLVVFMAGSKAHVQRTQADVSDDSVPI